MSIKWNPHHLTLAAWASTWSKDPTKKCGAAIIRPDGSVAATGCNRFPRYLLDTDESLYHERAEKLPRMLHAERTALWALKGEEAYGYSIYIWPLMSCDVCASGILEAGISTVIAPYVELDQTKWKAPILRALDMYRRAKVNVGFVPQFAISDLTRQIADYRPNDLYLQTEEELRS